MSEAFRLLDRWSRLTPADRDAILALMSDLLGRQVRPGSSCDYLRQERVPDAGIEAPPASGAFQSLHKGQGQIPAPTRPLRGEEN